jgi:hypothetical protein
MVQGGKANQLIASVLRTSAAERRFRAVRLAGKTTLAEADAVFHMENEGSDLASCKSTSRKNCPVLPALV